MEYKLDFEDKNEKKKKYLSFSNKFKNHGCNGVQFWILKMKVKINYFFIVFHQI